MIGYQTVKRLVALINSAAVLMLFTTTSCWADSNVDLSIEKKKSSSGMAYTLFDTTNLDCQFRVKRPIRTDDPSIKLCIPAAFTTKENTISGIYMCDGKTENRRATLNGPGGALIVISGDSRIVDTANGALLDDNKLLERLQELRASLFQQFLLVRDGQASTYKDKTKFQRRALVQFANRQAVVESEQAMTLSEFAKALAENFDAKEALYVDMGAWDEGWYVEPQSDKKLKIGQDRSLTWRQTNWLVFRAITKPNTKGKFPADIERAFGEDAKPRTKKSKLKEFPFSQAQLRHYSRLVSFALGLGLLLQQLSRLKSRAVDWRVAGTAILLLGLAAVLSAF